MVSGGIHISTRPPLPPEEADFALIIQFQKDLPRPERIFQAADAMIRALQRVDKALCVSIDSNIEPIMMLEELETGSLKIWLRDVLTTTDDQALKDLNWRKIVGAFLVKAKYAYIEWVNKSEGVDLITFGREIRRIAEETNVRHLPDYSPPSYKEIAEATKAVDVAKNFLLSGDSIAFAAPDQMPVNFDLSIRWAPEELSDLAVKETIKFDNMPMVLIVKRPDYLGAAQWDLRHGKTPISAPIKDTTWLRRFQRRQVDVRPGDALRCRVTVENKYGYDHELIEATHTITAVDEVLENHVSQTDLEGL